MGKKEFDVISVMDNKAKQTFQEFCKQVLFCGSTLMGLLSTLDKGHNGNMLSLSMYILLPLCILFSLVSLYIEAAIAKRDYQNSEVVLGRKESLYDGVGVKKVTTLKKVSSVTAMLASVFFLASKEIKSVRQIMD